MKRSIVGLDLSLSSTGFCRITGDDLVTEAIKTDVKKEVSVVKRSIFIAKSIRDRIKLTDVIFIEDYAFGVSPKSSSAVTLGELGGIVKAVLLGLTRTEPMTITTGEMRKFLSNDGKLKKDMIPREVLKQFGLEPESHDECVAIVLAKIGQAVVNPNNSGMAFYRLKIVNSLKKKHKDILQSIATKKS